MNNLTVEQAFNRAVEFQRNGKIEEADRLYTAILSANPDHAHANHNMGVLAVSLNKIELALPFFERALSSDTQVVQFWVSLVDALLKLRQTEHAQKLLLDAKTKNIQSQQLNILQQQLAHILDAQSFTVQKKLDSIKALHDKGLFLEAIRDGELALKTTRSDANLYALVSQSLLSVNEIERAHRYLKAAESLEPNNLILLKNYIRYYLKTKDVEKAKQYSKNLISHSPSDPEGLMLLGACYRSEGNFAKALSYFSDSLEIDLENAEAFANRGIIHLELDNLDEAVSDLGSAFRLKSHVEQIWLPFLKALFQKRQFKGVIDAVVKMAEINPKRQELINLLEASLEQEANVDNAIATYRNLIQFDPSSFILNFNYMNWMFRKSDLSNVLKVAEELLKHKINEPSIHMVIASVYRQQGKIQAALQNYKLALSGSERDAEILSNIGAIYASMLQHDQALENFKKSIAVKADYTLAHYNLGNTYLDIAQYKLAVESYTTALALNPTLSHAWNNLKQALNALKIKQLPTELKNIATEGKPLPEVEFYKASLEYELNEGSDNSDLYFDKAKQSLDKYNIRTIENAFNNRNELDYISLPVIGLTHFGRSGTGLLHSLIDGHTEVSTLPSIYLSEFFDPATWNTLVSNKHEEIVDNFMAMYDVLFDARSEIPIRTKSGEFLHDIGIKEGMANVGSERNEFLSLDRDIFRSHLLKNLRQTPTLNALTLFRNVHRAFDHTINDAHSKRVLFYHIHNPSTHAALNFSRMLPDAKMIVMVREPLQSLESWSLKLYQELDYKRLVFRIQSLLYELDSSIYSIHETVGVRLEDVKLNPSTTLKSLCAWMGINEEKSIYNMTAQGKPWWGDPASPDYYKDGMDPFGKTSINRKVGSIFSNYDQYILGTLFYPFSARFGYIEDNVQNFERDLINLEPLLHEMFDFEKSLSAQLQISHKDFMESGHFALLRSSLLDRFNTLKRHGTYPRMISKL